MRRFAPVFSIRVFAVIPLLFALAKPATAATAEKLPAFSPHYMSQRGAQADLREGPSYDHKILWVYRHKAYPFHVVAAFDIWRRVQAADGTLGWMSVAMLSENRTVLVTGKGRAQIRSSADPTSRLTGLADPDAILGVKACEAQACKIAAGGITGWIGKDRIWGVGADETFK